MIRVEGARARLREQRNTVVIADEDAGSALDEEAVLEVIPTVQQARDAVGRGPWLEILGAWIPQVGSALSAQKLAGAARAT